MVVRLTWDDIESNELGYLIRRSEDAQVTWADLAVLPANSTSYVDSDSLVDLQFYYYSVTALCDNCQSTPVIIQYQHNPPPPVFADIVSNNDVMTLVAYESDVDLIIDVGPCALTVDDDFTEGPSGEFGPFLYRFDEQGTNPDYEILLRKTMDWADPLAGDPAIFRLLTDGTYALSREEFTGHEQVITGSWEDQSPFTTIADYEFMWSAVDLSVWFDPSQLTTTTSSPGSPGVWQDFSGTAEWQWMPQAGSSCDYYASIMFTIRQKANPSCAVTKTLLITLIDYDCV